MCCREQTCPSSDADHSGSWSSSASQGHPWAELHVEGVGNNLREPTILAVIFSYWGTGHGPSTVGGWQASNNSHDSWDAQTHPGIAHQPFPRGHQNARCLTRVNYQQIILPWTLLIFMEDLSMWFRDICKSLNHEMLNCDTSIVTNKCARKELTHSLLRKIAYSSCASYGQKLYKHKKIGV